MKLLRLILQKNYCKNCLLVDNYEKQNLKLSKENSDIKSENDTFKRMIKLMNDKVDTNTSAIYFKLDEDVIKLITVKNHYDYQCKLIRVELDGYFFHIYEYGRIIPQTMDIDVIYKEHKDNENVVNYCLENFYIASLNCTPNKGYGSLLMEQFLDYIKPFGAKYVSGFISNYDASNPEHKSRLFHFYQKFGFTIGDVNDKGDYPIKLNLR